MKRRLIALTLAGALTLGLAACSAPGSSSGSQSQQPPASGGAGSSQSGSGVQAEAAFPVTLIDAAGREVTIEARPEKLVSGYYITTSMLIALGLADDLVGVEAKADTRPIYAMAAPRLLELTSVGTAKEFNLEGCAALEPDLVILPLKLKDSAEALADLGIDALVVDPESLEDLNDTIALLGQATGAGQAALDLLDYNRETADLLADTLAGADKPAVYLAGNSSYLNTAGPAMYQHTLIDMGGGENVAAGLTADYWAEIDYEQLLAWDPDVILIAAGADYTRDDLLSDPQLAGLAAVERGAVYAMPSSFEAWDSPVPSAMLGSRWVASVLHEDLYPFADFQRDVAGFYRTFYGFEADQSLVTK